jgi:YfiH family protein
VDFAEIVPNCPENVSESDAADLDRDIAVIDVLYEKAGLVRNRCENTSGSRRRTRFQTATREELSPAPPNPTIAANGVEWLRVPAWGRIPWLWHGFSTRRGGVSLAYCPGGAAGELNLGFTADDDRANVLKNRRLLAEAVTGSPDTPLATVRQIHSSVLVIRGQDSCADGAGSGSWGQAGPPSKHPNDKDPSSGTPAKGDGLMTDEPGVLLGIQTADCIPVLVADRRRRAVAAFHAGWRGTVKRIVENGVGRMRMEFDSRPEDLVAAIGPGIGACCYAVGEDVLSEFESQFGYGRELFREVYDTDPVRAKYPALFLTQRAPGHSPVGTGFHLDLIGANRRQLLAAGVSADAIEVAGACPNCHAEMFFSHRASRGRCGRMMSVVGIRRAET